MDAFINLREVKMGIIKKIKWGFFAACLTPLLMATGANAAQVTSVSATITTPVAGRSPSFTATLGHSTYMLDWVTWDKCTGSICTTHMSASDKFVAGQTYEVGISVYAIGDNVVYPPTPTATINGQPAQVGSYRATPPSGVAFFKQYTVPYLNYAVNPTSYTFPAQTVGYTPASKQFRFTGDDVTLSVALSGANASSFELDKNSVTIGPKSKPSFNVSPKAGLKAGTYNATIVLSGINVQNLSVNISFTVNAAPTPPSGTGTGTGTGTNTNNGGGGGSSSGSTTSPTTKPAIKPEPTKTDDNDSDSEIEPIEATSHGKEPRGETKKSDASNKNDNKSESDTSDFPWWIVVVASAVLLLGCDALIVIKASKKKSPAPAAAPQETKPTTPTEPTESTEPSEPAEQPAPESNDADNTNDAGNADDTEEPKPLFK